jgi:hypothetical protein
MLRAASVGPSGLQCSFNVPGAARFALAPGYLIAAPPPLPYCRNAAPATLLLGLNVFFVQPLSLCRACSHGWSRNDHH